MTCEPSARSPKGEASAALATGAAAAMRGPEAKGAAPLTVARAVTRFPSGAPARPSRTAFRAIASPCERSASVSPCERSTSASPREPSASALLREPPASTLLREPPARPTGAPRGRALRRPRALFGALLTICGLALAAPEAQAQTLIRDAEVESTLKRLSTPIFEASGLAADDIEIFIRLDPAINAFVFGGRNMVLNTGLITRLETPEALIGVIAHETGHVTGGHLARRAIAVRNTAGPAALGLLLAAAAAAGTGEGGAGAAIALGSQAAIRRGILAFSRGEEASADQAGAEYMERAGVDPAGMLEVLKELKGQEIFAAGRIDPYALSHPLSSERIALLERRVESSRAKGAKVSEEVAYWHARMRAKLASFIDRPARVLSRIEADGAPLDELGLYRRAVAYHRLPEPDTAIAYADQLIALRPDDPFYWELKGQILFESGRAEAAVEPYRRAVALAPSEPLLRGGLGRALLALGNPAADAEALRELEAATRDDPGEVAVLRDLALAYARDGQNGMASLATAERYALIGDGREATIHAKRAMAQLPESSAGWLRADDILAVAAAAE